MRKGRKVGGRKGLNRWTVGGISTGGQKVENEGLDRQKRRKLKTMSTLFVRSSLWFLSSSLSSPFSVLSLIAINIYDTEEMVMHI